MKTKREKVLRELYRICLKVLPEYKNNTGHKWYKFPQLISMWLYGKIFNLTFRDIQEEFAISEELRKIIGINRVPDYTTICRAVGKLTEEEARRIFQESVNLFPKQGDILACDSTGIRADNMSSYYQARSGKTRKFWWKLVYLVDTKTKSVISQRIGIGPSSDAPFLADMKGEIDLGSKIVIADSGFDGCRNETFAIFRPIRRGGRIKDVRRWQIYFKFLVAKLLGIYGKRWISETVFSVIKRRFGDRVRSRTERKILLELMLTSVCYNVYWFIFLFCLLFINTFSSQFI